MNLNVIKTKKLKNTLTKLRIGTHILMTAQGGYQNPKLSREHLYCPVCFEM